MSGCCSRDSVPSHVFMLNDLLGGPSQPYLGAGGEHVEGGSDLQLPGRGQGCEYLFRRQNLQLCVHPSSGEPMPRE